MSFLKQCIKENYLTVPEALWLSETNYFDVNSITKDLYDESIIYLKDKAEEVLKEKRFEKQEDELYLISISNRINLAIELGDLLNNFNNDDIEEDDDE